VPVALRSDKPATAIVRETAEQIGDGPVRTVGKFDAGGIKVSNAERVIDPSNGRAKLDLVR
jgi:bifunctional non-homologous end joining protein LigD